MKEKVNIQAMQRFAKREEYEEWKDDKSGFAEETQDEHVSNSETKEIEQSYQILKLKLGATEKQIKQAYEKLINVWHPEELSKYPYLQQRAYERMKQVELAYEKLVREYVEKKR